MAKTGTPKDTRSTGEPDRAGMSVYKPDNGQRSAATTTPERGTGPAASGQPTGPGQPAQRPAAPGQRSNSMDSFGASGPSGSRPSSERPEERKAGQDQASRTGPSGNGGQPANNGQPGKSGPAEMGGPDVLIAAVRDTASASVEAVKAQAGDLANNVGAELSKVAETQKVRGADQIDGMAKAVGSAADELAKESPQLASTVRSLGKQLESLSQAFREKSVGELVNSASDVARNQPVAFMAGSLAAGFAFARFIKSSSRSHAAPAPKPVVASTGRESFGRTDAVIGRNDK